MALHQTFHKAYPVMSVRLWNFKDGGSFNSRFLPKNQHAQMIFFEKLPSIFDIEN